MNRKIAIFLFFVLFSPIAQAADQATRSWKTFRSTDGALTFKYPFAFQIVTSTENSKVVLSSGRATITVSPKEMIEVENSSEGGRECPHWAHAFELNGSSVQVSCGANAGAGQFFQYVGYYVPSGLYTHTFFLEIYMTSIGRAYQNESEEFREQKYRERNEENQQIGDTFIEIVKSARFGT